MYVWM